MEEACTVEDLITASLDGGSQGEISMLGVTVRPCHKLVAVLAARTITAKDMIRVTMGWARETMAILTAIWKEMTVASKQWNRDLKG